MGLFQWLFGTEDDGHATAGQRSEQPKATSSGGWGPSRLDISTLPEKLVPLARKANDHAMRQDWGRFARAHHDMAETFWERGERKRALWHFMVVAIFRLQGGTNAPHRILGSEDETREFQPRESVGDGVLSSAQVYLSDRDGRTSDLEPIFEDAAEAVWMERFPLGRDEVWRRIREKI